MKYNAYKILSELLAIGPHPNTDMLIVKPSLFAYIANEKIKDAIANGISAPDKQIKVYFTRVPEKVEKYQEFIKTNSPIKIMVAKLKKIKDQMIKIYPANLDGYQNSLTEDDVKDLGKKTKFFADYFNRGEDLEHIPHAVIRVPNGVLPAFCLKVLTPEKRLISDDIL